jgi:hypothetical protein
MEKMEKQRAEKKTRREREFRRIDLSCKELVNLV